MTDTESKSKSEKYFKSIIRNPTQPEGNTESNTKSESEKYVKSIIQPNLRVKLNPNPNPNPLDNTDLKFNPTREPYPIRTRTQIH